MSSQDGTLPVRDTGIPVRRIRARVEQGPDAGRGHTASLDVLTLGTAEGNDLVLTDPTVSRFHAELRREGDRIGIVDRGSTNGTVVGPALVRNAVVQVRAGSVFQLGETTVRVDDGDVVMADYGPSQLGELRGRTPAMRRLMATIAQVAGTLVPVLVLGESGTGKELVARALHEGGPRAEGPFVAVDCGALTPTLFASELFGHERGAFTGADHRRIGAIERAAGGTLFLDEVGELAPEQQASLLGVLERGRFRRLGGSEDIEADVRLVSATHRDLYAAVNAGSFRLDLFYRLVVVRIDVPPLRERLDDITLLVEHFLAEAGHAGDVSHVFPEESLARLRRHDWPGNVRELRNVVLGTLALGTPPQLGAPDAGTAAPDADPVSSVLHMGYRNARRAVLDDFERRYLGGLLERTDGNVRAAAREAGMDRSYLMELLRRHGFR